MMIERWCEVVGDNVIEPRVDDFLKEVMAVCAKHGLVITHEDGHGAYIIKRLKDDQIDPDGLYYAGIDLK